MDLGLLVEWIIKSVVIMGVLLTGFAYETWLERKVVSKMQFRIGPNRAGPFGLLLPLADGIKLIFKEELTPAMADKWVFRIAPIMSMVVALITFAVIPVGPSINLFGRVIPLRLADVNIGLMYVLAVSSLGIYGIVLGGWSSNNKYALLGGMRSAAQLISYELALGLSLMGVVMLTGSLSLVDIVNAQAGNFWNWNIFLQPLGFILYGICGLAETNRAPFDLPEAEQELTAGYHTEYSGMKFALFFMAEYINMVNVSAIASTMFLGGWRAPFGFIPEWTGPIWFFIKVITFLFIYIWLRATVPRLRYDQLMNFGWKVLLPLAIANVIVTAITMALRQVYAPNAVVTVTFGSLLLMIAAVFLWRSWTSRSMRRRPPLHGTSAEGAARTA
ncbi:MAG: NADH-quinone oxidoreductase subunit NuoH [Anaerolineae bacterium]|nr:NADH-quinone oxidoreductase subunit NuoH [Anaerolineae bacterium]